MTTVVLGGVCLWLVLMAIGAGLRHHSFARELAALQGRIQTSQRDTARISQELGRMSQPGWLALLARERLNYQQPGETVVFVYTTEKADTIQAASVEDSRPNWRKWLDWISGK